MSDRHLDRVGVDATDLPAGVPERARTAAAVVAAVAVGLLGWQALVSAADLPAVLLPSPGAVYGAGVANAGRLAAALRYTALEVALGWTLGVAVGVAFAGAMAWSGPVRRVVYPYLVAVRIVPVIVIAPVLIVVLGPTLLTRALLATLLVFFPVTVATLDGLRAAPEDQIALLRSVGAPRWRRFLSVRVPNAVPSVVGGLEIATPLAIEGVVLAEFLAGTRGIGVVLLGAANRLQTALLFAAMFALVAFGVAAFGAVRLLGSALAWDDATGSLGVDLLGTDDALSALADPRSLAALGVAAVGLVALWQALTAALPTADLFLAPPGAVVRVLLDYPGLFVATGAATLAKLLTGWALGAAVGFALGATVALVPPLRVPVYAYLAGFRVMPVVAFAPLLLVWFGVSSASAALLVAASTFFPVAIGTAAGLRRLPSGYADLLRTVDAPAWRALVVRFRYGVPELFAGVKLSAITGMSGVIVAEWFVASEGLGVLVLQQTRTFQADLSFAAIAVLFAIGASLFGLTALVQQRLQW